MNLFATIIVVNIVWSFYDEYKARQKIIENK